MNDLLLAADSGLVSILVLLDLTAAFHTVNHVTLLHRLETWTEITNSVLSCFWSYLFERQQFVSLGNYRSDSLTLSSGVQQDTVLKPLHFSIYMLSLLC